MSATKRSGTGASSEFVDSVQSGSIASGSVQGFFGPVRNIASGTLGIFDLGSGAIVAGSVGSGAIRSGNIASGQIGPNHLGSGAVLSGAVASGQIGNFAVASGAITSGRLGVTGTPDGTKFFRDDFAWAAVGGGSSITDVFYKDFFTQAAMLPTTVYKEEMYVFPARDFEDNLGPGGAVTHQLLQSRDRLQSVGNTDYRFGWDVGAPHNKMLFVLGGLRQRGFSVGIAIAPATSMVGGITFFDEPFGGAGIVFAGPGGSDSSTDYQESSDTRNRECSYAIYYSKADQIVRGFMKFEGGQWFPMGSYTADEGQMRYAIIRVVPAGTERYNAVCPLVIRYE
jgi:hypothetical protein